MLISVPGFVINAEMSPSQFLPLRKLQCTRGNKTLTCLTITEERKLYILQMLGVGIEKYIRVQERRGYFLEVVRLDKRHEGS